MLVAAKVTAKRRMARNIVPKIATSRVLSAEHIHLRSVDCTKGALTSVKPRNTTAIPKTTQRKAGVSVTTAAKVRKAVITPIKRLTITAKPIQSQRLSQQNIDINFHLITVYARGCLVV